MFTSPENKGMGEEMDLDFTKPGALSGMEVQEDHASVEDKILELQNNIASTERGIKLAESLDDTERVSQMKMKKEEFEATLAMLEGNTQPKEQAKTFEVADFDQAMGADREVSKVAGREEQSKKFREELGL
jgi:hypothetical protein